MQLTPSEIGRKYDDIAPYYDRFERVGKVLGVHRLRRSLFGRATGDVLEIAVGTGRNLQFYPSTCRITAVDISQGMLHVARKQADQLGRVVNFEQMNAEALAFSDDSFDTVTSSLSTCTFPDPIAALAEMGRVCRTNGRILLFEHGRSSAKLIGRLQDRFADSHARRIGCHWNREPGRLVEDAGLRLISDRRTLFGVLHVIEAAP